MPPTTETEMQKLRELVLSLREEMRVGFAEVKSELKSEIKRVEAATDLKFAEIKFEIQRVEAKTDIKFAEVKTEIANLSGDVRVIDERTKLGFWGFVGRALVITAIGGVIGFGINRFIFGGSLGH